MASEKPKPERKPRLIAEPFKGRKQAERAQQDDPPTERFPKLTEALDEDERR